jgi:hypothetical protein
MSRRSGARTIEELRVQIEDLKNQTVD